MFNRLTDAQTEILKEIDANVKLVVLEGTPRQQFLYLMAGYLVEGDDRKMWYIYHAIMSIIVIDEVDDLLRQRYGKEYPELLDRMFKYGTILRRMKLLLDQIDPKKLEDDIEFESKAVAEYWKLCEKLPLIDYYIYDIFEVICLHSSLGKNTVPSSAIQMMERELKKVVYGEERQRFNRPDQIERPFESS
jgi:hypothetical protein